MGAAAEGSKGGKYIKQPVRKAIKTMAYMSQIATCVNLLPTPEEFATQVVGEVITLMGKIRDFTTRLNDMMETYTNFPSDYLAQSTNNIMGTLTDYANVATNASQGMVNALHQASDNIDYLISSTSNVMGDAHNGLNDVSNGIDNAVDKVNTTNEKVNASVQKAIDYINDKMKKVNDTLNDAFSDYIIEESKVVRSTEELDKITESTDTSTMGGTLVAETTETMSTIVKNFNIGKIATGFLGLATNIGLIEIGLDKLPELNLDNVLSFGRAKMDEVYEKKRSETREFKESEEYQKMVEDAEGDKKKLREAIRNKRKASAQERRKGIESISKEEREARRSVAKDVRNAKKQAKKARIAQKYKETIGLELERFKTDLKMFGTNIKDEWTMMKNQYKEAVDQIKKFFTGDANNSPGSKYIDDCCDAIELDCDSIKEILKNLTTTITVTVSQIPCPTSVGSCIDNPLYKVLRWFECLKTIFNEIKRVINYGIDIIKQIDNLVKIILNGLNSMREIKEKLMKILNIQWLLDLIDSIINLFMGKCLEGKELIENTLSPVYYKDTDDYENRMNYYENEVSNINEEDEDQEDYAEQLQEAIERLEEQGESIIAYKSPKLTDDGNDFKAWVFFHTNIDNRYRSRQFLKRFFSRLIMKKAVKTGNRKNGGVNLLRSRRVFTMPWEMTVLDGSRTNRPKAYDAFYWYTKWTTDPNDDGLSKDVETDENGNIIIDTDDHTDEISPVMTTENGTLVELEDGRRVFVNDFGIKSGDFVLVEGKRYRVK